MGIPEEDDVEFADEASSSEFADEAPEFADAGSDEFITNGSGSDLDYASEASTDDDLYEADPASSGLDATADLAEAMGQPRWLAQKLAYCLRESGAAELCGKAGNALLYRRA